MLYWNLNHLFYGKSMCYMETNSNFWVIKNLAQFFNSFSLSRCHICDNLTRLTYYLVKNKSFHYIKPLFEKFHQKQKKKKNWKPLKNNLYEYHSVNKKTLYMHRNLRHRETKKQNIEASKTVFLIKKITDTVTF